jgi:ferredoxin
MCLIEAPENFKILEDCYEGAYVYKQPETLEEENQCESAILCCPHIAIFGDGETKIFENHLC